jgi:hypothetical protein
VAAGVGFNDIASSIIIRNGYWLLCPMPVIGAGV